VTGEPPTIVAAGLAERTRALAEAYSPWRNAPGDLGEGLIEAFGRIADVVATRINRVPEKNLLAFLDLIGVRLQPPKPARVPLTFQLAAGAGAAVPIPAGTPVGAVPLEGEEAPPTFETERALVATPAQLLSVVSVDSHRDRYRDNTSAAAPEAPTSFRAFAGTEPFEHALYLASPLFAAAASKSAEIFLAPVDPEAAWWVKGLEWSCWDGAWRRVPASAQPAGSELTTEVGLGAGTWVVRLDDMPNVVPIAVGAVSGFFVRARLPTTVPRGASSAAAAEATTIAEAGLDPDAAFADGEPLDFTEPEVPFDGLDAGSTFYLASSDAFSKPGARVRLDVAMDPRRPSALTADLALAWRFYSVDGWVELTPDGHGLEDGTLALARSGTVSFRCPEWFRTVVNGVEGWWLSATITSGSYDSAQPPYVAAVTIGYEWELPRVSGIAVRTSVDRGELRPELAFTNQVVVDLHKDFFPFGEKPALNDTLYLASDETLGTPGSDVTLEVELTNPADEKGTPKPAGPSPDLVVRWEYWNASADRWDAIPGLVDGTSRFTSNGAVHFVRPASLGLVAVNGELRHWIRARIAAGNYGTEAHYVEVTRENKKTYDLVLADFRPPSISSLELRYAHETDVRSPEHVLTENGFAVEERTAELAEAGFLEPFVPGEDVSPALYLGFDRPFPDSLTSLYLGVVEARFAARLRRHPSGDPPTVVWEYWNPAAAAWGHLQAEDETRGLVRRGLVLFIGPPGHGPAPRFGVVRHWLRARWADGEYAQPPELEHILPNTMWASHASTVRDETLGSGNGERHQELRLSRAPVVGGAQVEVRELEAPPDEEVADLGPGAVRRVDDAAGRAEVWVRWREVTDFYDSGPRSRHYTLDPSGGLIRFGDGVRGLLPPRGRDNVVARRYRTGGGLVGNRAAGTVTELATTVPYVASVTNVEPASGGSAAETLEQARVRGPRTLRHRGRAVAIADFEDLAVEASADVARVRGFPVRGPEEAGRVGLVVLPHSDEPRPAPSIELLNRVEEYVRRRASPVFDLWVGGPGWLRVRVRAEVVPLSLEQASDVESRVRARLAEFLHPLRGGVDGAGWPFGRRPHRSDLYGVIEAVAGVDHVQALDVEETMAEPSPIENAFLVYGGAHEIAMTGGDEP
jgi:hypothetical protein